MTVLPDCQVCGGKGIVIDPDPAPLQSALIPCPAGCVDFMTAINTLRGERGDAS